MEPRALRIRLRRGLLGAALVFTLGLGIGAAAGALSHTAPRPGGSAEERGATDRAPTSVPASRGQRAEAPLIFVAFDSDGVDGEPWML